MPEKVIQPGHVPGIDDDLLAMLRTLTRAEQRRLYHALQTPPKVDEMVRAFAIHIEASGLAKETREKYVREVRRFLTWAAAELGRREDEVVMDDLRESLCMQFVYRKKEDGSACAGDTHCWRYTVLQRFFSFVSEREGYLRVPLVHGRGPRPRPSPREHVGLRPEQVRELYAILRQGRYGVRDYHLGYVLANLGLRASEAAALKIGDVHLDTHSPEITVRRHKQGRGQPPQPKTMRLLPQVAERLGSYIAFLNQGGPLPPEAPLFPSERGDRSLTPDGVSRIIKAALRKLGRTEGAAHILRHTCALTLLSHGVPLPQIAHYLDHKSVKTTVVYLRMDMNLLHSWMESHYPHALESLEDYAKLLSGGADA